MNAARDAFSCDLFAERPLEHLVEVHDTPPPAPEPWTEEEWKRVLRRLPFRVVTDSVKADYAAGRTVQCMGCANALGHGGDPWGAWCAAHRRRVSNTFPKLCRKWVRA